MPINHILYNFDTVKDCVVIVEGVTDVWRMGDGFVCSFRKAMTPEQIQFLMKKRIKRAFVMYDADAKDQSYALANQLSGLIEIVEVLELDGGDPADMALEDVMNLRAEVFGGRG